MLQGDPEVTAFRAESEIQDHFRGRDDGSFRCAYERIYFDTEAGPPWQRLRKTIATRYRDREPRILPFSERLQGFDIIQSWELFTDWTAQAVAARERYGIPLSVMVWDNIPFNMERNPERRRLKEHAAIQAYLTATVMNLKKLVTTHPTTGDLLQTAKHLIAQLFHSWTRPHQHYPVSINQRTRPALKPLPLI